VLFEPIDFVAKLAALVPRPRKNLVLYHGVLSANAAWRSRVICARHAFHREQILCIGATICRPGNGGRSALTSWF
jgi:hypothetical protein